MKKSMLDDNAERNIQELALALAQHRSISAVTSRCNQSPPPPIKKPPWPSSAVPCNQRVKSPFIKLIDSLSRQPWLSSAINHNTVLH